MNKKNIVLFALACGVVCHGWSPGNLFRGNKSVSKAVTKKANEALKDNYVLLGDSIPGLRRKVKLAAEEGAEKVKLTIDKNSNKGNKVMSVKVNVKELQAVLDSATSDTMARGKINQFFQDLEKAKNANLASRLGNWAQKHDGLLFAGGALGGTGIGVTVHKKNNKDQSAE